MLVKVSMDSMGAVHLNPVQSVHSKLRRAWRKHLAQFMDKPVTTVYLQDATDFLESLSPSQRREVELGYTIRIRMDAWVYANYLGYDCCEVIA